MDSDDPTDRANNDSSSEKRGLCLACALAFMSDLGPEPGKPDLFGPVLPRDHWMSEVEYCRGWRDPEYRAELHLERQVPVDPKVGRPEWEGKYVEKLLGWPRCDDCPIWIAGSNFQPHAQYDVAPTPPRCGTCYRGARLQAWMKFPEPPTPILARVHQTPSDIEAFWIGHHAAMLISNGRKSFVRSYPRCADCPVTTPAKVSTGTGVEKLILNALAGHGGPMTVGELLDAGIKGLTKNNIAKIMKALVASGAVILTTRGPAKFFELP